MLLSSLRNYSFRIWISQVSLCLCYIPVNVSPYIALYSTGYLKDICPSIVLLIFQISILLGKSLKKYKMVWMKNTCPTRTKYFGIFIFSKYNGTSSPVPHSPVGCSSPKTLYAQPIHYLPLANVLLYSLFDNKPSCFTFCLFASRHGQGGPTRGRKLI